MLDFLSVLRNLQVKSKTNAKLQTWHKNLITHSTWDLFSQCLQGCLEWLAPFGTTELWRPNSCPKRACNSEIEMDLAMYLVMFMWQYWLITLYTSGVVTRNWYTGRKNSHRSLKEKQVEQDNVFTVHHSTSVLDCYWMTRI